MIDRVFNQIREKQMREARLPSGHFGILNRLPDTIPFAGKTALILRLQALLQFAERRLQLAANDHRRIGFRAARHQ